MVTYGGFTVNRHVNLTGVIVEGGIVDLVGVIGGQGNSEGVRGESHKTTLLNILSTKPEF